MKTPEQRLQDDIENICEMAIDDINAALWHWTRNPKQSIDELVSAITNITAAVELMRGDK